MISDIQRILDCEKARKIYENRIDSCFAECNLKAKKEDAEHRQELIDTYNALIERYEKIIQEINKQQKETEDNLIACDNFWDIEDGD